MSVGVVMVGVDKCVSGCGDGWGGQVCQWVW